MQVRGIGDMAWELRRNATIIEGRKFTPGMRELVAGKGAQRQFQGLEVGHEVKLGNQLWTVVGIFESDDAMESELWGDAGVVGPTYRPNGGNSRTPVRMLSMRSRRRWYPIRACRWMWIPPSTTSASNPKAPPRRSR